MKVNIIVEDKNLVPLYKTIGSGACDLHANIKSPQLIRPSAIAKVKTGIKVHIKDKKFGGLIIPRSGLGTKGLVLANTVGLIDSDYQGELIVSLWNRSNAPITIEPMDSIAQFMLVPLVQADFNVVESFETKTKRGSGGFGSTGK